MLTLISFIYYGRGKPSHGLSVRQKKVGGWLKRTMKRHSKNVRLHKYWNFAPGQKTPEYTSKFPCACMHSHSISSTLCAPRTTAHQAPLVVEFLRQYWSVLPFPPPGDLFNPGVKPTPPASAGRLFPNWEAQNFFNKIQKQMKVKDQQNIRKFRHQMTSSWVSNFKPQGRTAQKFLWNTHISYLRHRSK